MLQCCWRGRVNSSRMDRDGLLTGKNLVSGVVSSPSPFAPVVPVVASFPPPNSFLLYCSKYSGPPLTVDCIRDAILDNIPIVLNCTSWTVLDIVPTTNVPIAFMPFYCHGCNNNNCCCALPRQRRRMRKTTTAAGSSCGSFVITKQCRFPSVGFSCCSTTTKPTISTTTTSRSCSCCRVIITTKFARKLLN